MSRTVENTKSRGRRTDEDDEAEEGQKDISAALKDIDQGEWEETEEASFAAVDDGKYQVKIVDATIGRSKSESKRLQVTWELEIMNTKFAGRKLFKHDGIETPENRGWFRGGLARLGVDWPKSANELPELLGELKDSYAEVKVVTKKGSEMPSVYFNEAIDEKDLEEPDPSTDTVPEKKASSKKDKDEPEEEDDEPDPKDKKKGKDEPDVKVVTNFTDDDLKGRHIKRIEELADEFKYDPKNYKTSTDILADIAEVELGIEGEFENPQDLINEVEDAIEEKLSKEKASSSRRK